MIRMVRMFRAHPLRAPRVWPVVALATLAVLLSGCGYTLAGGDTVPAGIRRIGVPTFENLTPYPELDRMFTEAVRAELQTHRKYTVVPDATGVDAVLIVSIKTLTGTVTAFTADTRQASRYTLSALVSGEFKDLKGNASLWSNQSLRLADDFDVPNDVASSDLASLFAQDRNALQRISNLLAKRLVDAILSSS